MFKPKLIAGAAALCLSLGACVSTGGTSFLNQLIGVVSTLTLNQCRADPTGRSVNAVIMALGGPDVPGIAQLATAAICGVVDSQAAPKLAAKRRGVAPPAVQSFSTVATINGKRVTIAGQLYRD